MTPDILAGGTIARDLVPAPESAPRRLRAVQVGIGEDGPYPAVVALGDGSQSLSDASLGWAGNPIPRWNGWIAEPTFDRATAEQIGAMLAAQTAAYGTDSDSLTWDADVVVMSHGPDHETAERIAPDADGRYAIGAYSWCWYVWDEDAARGILSDDECTAIGADGRDGRGIITEDNLTPAEAVALATYRATYGPGGRYDTLAETIERGQATAAQRAEYATLTAGRGLW